MHIDFQMMKCHYSVKASEKTVYNQEKWTTKDSWYFTSKKIKYTSNPTKLFIPKSSSPYRNHRILIFKLRMNVKIPSSNTRRGDNHFCYLSILLCKACFEYKPQLCCNTDRRISSAHNTYHKRKWEVLNGCNSKDIKQEYHYKGCNWSI